MADGTWLVSHTFQPSDVITIDRVWQRRIPQAGGYELIQIMIDFRLAGRP